MNVSIKPSSTKRWIISLIIFVFNYYLITILISSWCFKTTQNMTRSRVPCFQGQSLPFFCLISKGGDVHLLGCPRRLAKGVQVGYNPNIRFLWVGFDLFTMVITIHLLSSWDILVDAWSDSRCLWVRLAPVVGAFGFFYPSPKQG